MRGARALRVAGPALALVAALACREEAPPGAPAIQGRPEPEVLRTSGLVAGSGPADLALVNPYASDAQAVAQGRELYHTMNCIGCHGGQGGGGIGPPLADADWIYGGQPENIVATIVRGRPNGMPSYGTRLPEPEIWKIAAFVATLAQPRDPGRPAIPAR